MTEHVRMVLHTEAARSGQDFDFVTTGPSIHCWTRDDGTVECWADDVLEAEFEPVVEQYAIEGKRRK